MKTASLKTYANKSFHCFPPPQNGIDLPEDFKKADNNASLLTTSSNTTATGAVQSYTLSQLFHDLSSLTQHTSSCVRYAVNKCKLDVVFERILDKSEPNNLRRGSVYNVVDIATLGTPSTGYIHNGYVETET